MTSEQAPWYARTTSRYSSGSSWLESLVESTRLQNITVSWRRSASGVREVTTGDAASTDGVAWVGVDGMDWRGGEGVSVVPSTLPVQTSTRPSSSTASFFA